MFSKLAESWCGVCDEEGWGDCKACDLHALKNSLPITPTRVLADDEVAIKRATLTAIQQAFNNAEKRVHLEVNALADLTRALEVK